MGRGTNTILSLNPIFTQNNTTAAELYRLLGMVEHGNIQSSVPVPFKLIHTMLVTGLMDSGAGFATLDQQNGKKLADLGIQSLLSNLVGKNADGTLTESDGKFNARLQTAPIYDGSLDDSNSICIPLEIYGRNAYLIVPIVPLSQFGYRLLSCEEELLGTYFITPSNDWYKCEVKNGVPILDLRINVWENTISQERHMDIKIAKQPDFNLNFKNLITSGIIEASPFHTSALETLNFEHRTMSALEASWHGEYNLIDSSAILLDIDLDFDDDTILPANDFEKVPTKTRHHRFSLAPQNTPAK